MQELLEPAAQQILREEAARIPQWTAWLEHQRYRASTQYRCCCHAAAAAGDIDILASAEAEAAAPWNVFPMLYCFPAHDVSRRQWIEATAAHVPQTVQLLKRIVGDTLRTALFSRLDADSVVEAHTGWADLANHVYRVHVPIDIPMDDDGAVGDLCSTWVDGCVVTHAPDRLIVFDDSKMHRAFHYSSQPARVVLILDLARPPYLPLGTDTGGHSEELDSFIAQFASSDSDATAPPPN